MMQSKISDVLVLGYGPVGQVLALMLGRQGRSVAVCERWPERYPLPRAVCIDHEIYRVLTANGMGSILPSVSHPGPKYQWFNAAWEELLVIDWAAESISGGTEVNFIHQPTLEAAISEAASSLPDVETYLGWEVVSMTQDEQLCHVEIKDQSGQLKQLSARYVVGCDGANSLVRKQIGGVQEDRGFQADWLVIDVLLRDWGDAGATGNPGCRPVLQSPPTDHDCAGGRSGWQEVSSLGVYAASRRIHPGDGDGSQCVGAAEALGRAGVT